MARVPPKLVLRSFCVFENRVDPVQPEAPFEVWETCLANGQARGCELDMFCNCRREAIGALVLLECSWPSFDEAIEACDALNAPLLSLDVVPDQVLPAPRRLSRWQCWLNPDALPLSAPIDPDDVPF